MLVGYTITLLNTTDGASSLNSSLTFNFQGKNVRDMEYEINSTYLMILRNSLLSRSKISQVICSLRTEKLTFCALQLSDKQGIHSVAGFSQAWCKGVKPASLCQAQKKSSIWFQTQPGSQGRVWGFFVLHPTKSNKRPYQRAANILFPLALTTAFAHIYQMSYRVVSS